MEELILKLKQENIDIRVIDDKLKISVPKTFTDSLLVEEIRANKAALIAYVNKTQSKDSVISSIPTTTKDHIFKLTSAQMRMFISDDLTGDSLVYNLPQAYEIQGVLDKTKLSEAFNSLINLHESLRTVFQLDSEHNPQQEILDSVNFEVEHYEASKSEVGSIIKKFVRPFDLSKGPLIRAALVNVNSELHILLVDLHHIISDGTSQEVLIHDFMQLYKGIELSKVNVRYRDYLNWYLSEENQSSIATQGAFWKNEFSGTLPLLNLPTDYVRPVEKSYKGATHQFQISKETASALKEIAQQNNSSLFSVLLSVYSVLLSKLSSQEDIIIGTPVAGRVHADLQRMIGVFVNTLALRVFPQQEKSFLGFLNEVSKKTIQCFDHQSYPYERLVDDLGVERNPAHNPLFDTLFILQNIEKDTSAIDSLEIQSYEHEQHSTSKVDLSLFAFEGEEGVLFKFEYALDLFTETTIQEFSAYFTRIIDQIVSKNELKISEITLLSESDRSELMNASIGKSQQFFNETTIISLFEKQALKFSNEVALVLGNQTLTYKELNERSNQLAHKLQALGVSTDVLVGLLLDKSIEAVISLLAVLKAGGAYLPIDVNYPEDRIQYILENSGVKVLITTNNYNTFNNESEITLLIDDFNEEEWSKEAPERKESLSNLCYVIYTSGSTGNPKGVMITHGALVNYIGWASDYYLEGIPATFPLYTSFSFDLTVTSIFIPLVTGGKVLIYKDVEEATSIESIILDNKVDTIKLTPSHLKIISISEKLSESFAKSTIKRLIIGGEELTHQLAKEIHSKFNGRIKIYNEYGPTETTVGCMVYEFDIEKTTVSVPIGNPISNMNTYVLDANLNPVPKGVVGELYIAGTGVGRGYLNNETLTKQRFVSNIVTPETLMYKSGDLAMWSKEGEMIFKGRIDDQVKIRGYRIELGEIEHHLMRHDFIDQVALILRRNANESDQYLCAYYVAKTEVFAENLVEYLKERIPEYMVPAHLIQVDTIPLTSNDKVDFSQLPDPKETNKELYVAPVNYQEEVMTNIWAEVLVLPRVGTNDNFFGLGGDSIRAIGIISKINKKFKCSLTVADLHSNQTIKELSELLDKKEDEKNKKLLEQTEVDLQTFQQEYKQKNNFLANYEEVYPMNGVEKGMVFYSMKDADRHVYHIQKIYPIPYRNFDLDIFKKTVSLVSEKHDALRKIYDLKNFAHIVLKEGTPEINYMDISDDSLTYQEKYKIVEEKMYEERYKEIVLSMSLLWRINIIKIKDDFHLLMFNSHHSLFDGWSLSSFISELYNVYFGLVENKNFIPTKLQSSYKDHIIEELSATNKAASVAYWKKELEGYQRLEFPTTGLQHEYKMNRFDLGADMRKSLEKIATNYGTSFKHLTFAAYIYAMRMLTYDNDITVGVVTNNRPLTIDGEQLLGCFVNTIPFRTIVPSDITWGDYIMLVENKLREQKYHERMPFYKVLEAIGEGSQETNPIFDTSFNYTDFRVLEGLMSEDEVDFSEQQGYVFESFMNNNTLFDFNINAESKGFILTICYSTTVLNDLLSERLFYYFKNILNKFISHAREKIDKNSILPEEERKYLLSVNDYLDNTINYPTEETIVSIFEKKAQEYPEKTAVVFEDETLSYKEVNNLANKIAHTLLNKGVVRGDKVGLLIEKTHHVIPIMLGILKAGGCYIPIDTEYPSNRINYIIEDSGVNLVIAKSEHASTINDKCDVVLWDTIINANDLTDNPEQVNSPEDLCYVLYTSGTTGKPKGVMLEHKNVVRLLINSELQFEFSENDVWAMFHNHCFDFSVWEMYGALLYGGTLVVLSSQEAKDPSIYLEKVLRHKVTVLSQTPTAFDGFMKACESSQSRTPNLRYVIFGGEALTPSKLSVWHESNPSVKLINMYGITEVTVHTSFKEITSQEMNKNASNIGQSIPTTLMYLFDGEQNLVPQGVTGEIYVGGLGVARGYLNKEALTNERFIQNPFKTNDILYRSGDLARLEENGELSYVGRTDHQIQLKGHRIELSEIEYQLLTHETITDAFVLMKENAQGDTFLCAYFIAKEELGTELLREHLSVRIPTYMMPSYFMQIDEIPQTHNNKIDVRKLPEPKANIQTRYEAPTNNIEKTIGEVWEQTLGVEKIGINDNYFNLGGDSLKAIGLIFEINKLLQSSLTIADLYTYQTVAELSKAVFEGDLQVQEKALTLATEELYSFQEDYKAHNTFLDSYEEVYPMNGIEKGMVFHSLKRDSDNIHKILYHEQNIYPLSIKNFDFDVFNQALRLMIKKHDTLRKIFDLEHFAHIVKKEITPEVNFIDIRNLSTEDQESYIHEKMQEERVKATGLSFSVLWRMNIIKVKDDFQYLLFDLHHSLFDGWSLSSFITELNNIYYRLLKEPAFIPENLKSSYKDQILGEMIAIENSASQQYWKEELEDYVRLQFAPTGLTHEYKYSKFEMGASLRQQLEEVAIQHSTSFKHLCFAAYVYTMKMLSYSNDVTVGIITNNRPLVPDGEEVLGCFLNTVPFRAQFNEEMTWKDYVNIIEQKLRVLKHHERMPFYKILDIIGEQSQENNSIYDTSFNYIDFRVFNDMVEEEEHKGNDDVALEFDNYMNENTLLNFSMFAHNQGFKLVLTYSTSVVDERLLEQLRTHFTNVLHMFINNIDAPMTNNAIISEKETKQIFNEFNDLELCIEEGETLMSLFQNQVVKLPNKEAIRYENQILTYRELDQKSNQVAVYLTKEKGIKAGDIVGVYLDRELDLIPILFGILKIGAAYLPLDVKHPQERIVSIIEDSELGMIITRNEYLSDTEETHITLVDLDRELSVIYEQSNEFKDKSTPEGMSYVIYTSGSTGKPKGVMIAHKSVVNLLLAMHRKYPIEQGDSYLLQTNYAFDVSVAEIFGWYQGGGSLVILPKLENKEPAKIVKVIVENKITHVNFGPSLFSVVQDELEDIEVTNIESLKHIFLAGEALPVSMVERFNSLNTKATLENIYGPTEGTIFSTWYSTVNMDKGSTSVSIGKPLYNVNAYVLDKQNNIQPIGTPGELCLSGAGLALGYLNKPKLTQERFIKNPFVNGENMYKTGDLVAWDVDGNLRFLGRIDDQIKIRGNRVELGEIETTFNNIAGVKQSFVLVKNHHGTQQLVAYIKGSIEKIDTVKSSLAMKLPDYMIPESFVVLDEFPTTRSGKIDKKALPEPDVVTTTVYVAPETELEKQLAQVWIDVLGIERIGINDDVFKLGVNSLGIMKFIAKIRRVLDLDVPFNIAFKYVTISELAKVLSLAMEEKDNEEDTEDYSITESFEEGVI
ncbi:non-ribosomal peptide synthetase [Tenacibaculum sp. M341]|uniref:non-ribosomal peptide synthetase n=1 Tax=Tenacibaculum sp. M341 TaxID=2530339 RepID=UPI0010534946|nr:non-ribosomal peptide synthetase [Tenacibaculum sp. M341]TCI85724.1 amino acid adenylation domain-containing protein [Tenacibaculum sp. M341]